MQNLFKYLDNSFLYFSCIKYEKTSSRLEARFQEDSNSLFDHLTTDGHHVKVDFRSMSMTATFRSHDQRHLKRRPTCMDICEAEVKLVLSTCI